MSKENLRSSEKTSTPEKAWRFGRNINVLGALAVAGVAAVIPGPNAILAGYAGFNAAQAGGFEYLRRRSKKKREKKSQPKKPSN